MKKSLMLIVSLCLSVSMEAMVEYKDMTTTTNITDKHKPIFSKDGRVVIVVKGQPSTGYEWLWDHAATDRGIKLLSHHVTTSKTKLMGAPSMEEWVFQLPKDMMQAPTQTTISLTYARPWMPPSSVDRTTYVVRTVPNK